VAAGTFAIAGGVAAFYPIDSPGGWNLLGRTARDLEYALSPGDTITIVPTVEAIAERAPRAPAAALPFPLRVIGSPLARVVGAVDWSRATRGLSPGGPFDDVAATLANRAVGNRDDAPVLECALTGPRAIAGKDLVCSWYGAGVEISVNGSVVDDPRQFAVRAGDELRGGLITNGLRGYLAAGASRGEAGPLVRSDRLTIRALPGPHQSSVESLRCEVTPQLDRIGIRMRVLEPRGLAAPASLPSCGMQCGTLQLHPDGSVVAMGPDHPVTGGYLQPMTVLSPERWKLAQLAPGDVVHFSP
jgi:hypothetical protein